jgi:hypothetical protein
MAAEPTSSWTMYLRQDGSQTEQKWVVCCCSIDVLSTAIGVSCSFGWWLVLICSERKVLLAGCGWLLVAGLF